MDLADVVSCDPYRHKVTDCGGSFYFPVDALSSMYSRRFDSWKNYVDTLNYAADALTRMLQTML